VLFVFPSEPEPAFFVFGATGNPAGQPGGSCPSSESDTCPSGVLTWKLLLLLFDVVEDDDLFESSLEQPTATAPTSAAATATPANFRVVFTVPPVEGEVEANQADVVHCCEPATTEPTERCSVVAKVRKPWCIARAVRPIGPI
jgi:hypothetical protein